MPIVTQDQALELLAAEVRKFDTDELLEVYNEVFRNTPRTEQEAKEDPQALVARLVDHINGRAIEEVVALWGVIFPRHRNVWYNEEDDRIYYNEEAETVSTE